ncbi:hypothetical protein ACM01_27885 [Streptomyces viridochromogenes]|uniref:Uncharacterized protein n=2 Tax=Streptomyces viridochromogenes TaxID=1938 RepID=A0A0J7Z4Z2_STRVR|nr:hypothetical protein ACM01_27885 [Streptomyces viridochromogenes]KOG15894.1 hypothetical protein ADK36_28260 [Streptomyces viridochromogenes]KOG16683.1 hypothetical protein ADK35_26060 [Streptomyces viridochromogenes]
MSRTAHAERPTRTRPKSRRLHKLAVPAVLLSLTIGGLGMSATAHAASGPSCASLPAASCSATPSVAGTPAHPQAIPRGVQAALNYWRQISWPNFHNVAPRGAAFEVENYHDSWGTHHHGWIESGGQYYDHGSALRNFLHHHGPDARARGYAGTFQEYYGSVYPSNPERSGIATGNFRIVRAVQTGDVFVSIDHYSSFRYVGRP